MAAKQRGEIALPSFDAFTNFTGGTYEKEMHGAPGRGHAGALDSRLRTGGTLTVGVRDYIINFGYLNEKTGKYYGLEIDIAQEMAERMGYGEVEFVTVTPDNRKEMLLDGKVDCLIIYI